MSKFMEEKRIEAEFRQLQEGDHVHFADRSAEVIFVPGHTRSHCLLLAPEKASETGDLSLRHTLFAGCGRLFEGSPAQMVDSLSKLPT